MIKGNLLRSIKISLAIILIIILIFIIQNMNSDLYMVGILTCVYIISIYISPLITYLEKGTFSRRHNRFFILNGILSGISIITSYFVFISNNENVNIPFIIFIISFISIVVLQLVNEIKHFEIKYTRDNIDKYKLLHKLNLNFITCIIWIVVVVSLVIHFYEEEDTLYIRKLKIPNEILISSNRNINQDTNKTVIKNSNFIRNISKELENKEVTNIRNIEKIKYLKKIRNKDCYYVIPYYNSQNRTGVIDGYIDFIRIFKDGYCSIDEVSCKKGIQSYKITIPKDLLDDIERSIKNNNK